MAFDSPKERREIYVPQPELSSETIDGQPRKWSRWGAWPAPPPPRPSTSSSRGVIRILLERNLSRGIARCAWILSYRVRGDKYRRDTSPKQTAYMPTWSGGGEKPRRPRPSWDVDGKGTYVAGDRGGQKDGNGAKG